MPLCVSSLCTNGEIGGESHPGGHRSCKKGETKYHFPQYIALSPMFFLAVDRLHYTHMSSHALKEFLHT